MFKCESNILFIFLLLFFPLNFFTPRFPIVLKINQRPNDFTGCLKLSVYELRIRKVKHISLITLFFFFLHKYKSYIFAHGVLQLKLFRFPGIEITTI